MIYLERAGLLERVRRGVYLLTDEGKRLLSRAPPHIDINLLGEYPDFAEWKQRANASFGGGDATRKSNEGSSDTPEEALEGAVRRLSSDLEANVLHRVRDAASAFLERVVVNLLVAMKYGDSDAEMSRVTGRSGNGGIVDLIKRAGATAVIPSRSSRKSPRPQML